VIWLLPFEDMPDAGKHLVATLAARIFASQAVSDTAIVRHLTRDETEAEAAAPLIIPQRAP
jgi:hypothetical protein